MGFKYYCTNCAAQVDQTSELFDMKELLRPSSGNASFQILKFRLTGAEVLALYNSGVQMSGNARSCTLTMPQLMGYISNKNNLDVPEAAGLTMEQVIRFIDKGGVEATSGVFDGFGGVFGANLFDDEEEDDAQEAQEEETPAAIQQMIKKDATTDSAEFSEVRLREDLKILRNRMGDEGSYTFSLKPDYEDAVDGTKVMVGMTITDDVGNHIPLENRICPKCGEPVFKEAGTAEHKSVVFIGDQSSSKTSTILALTHYARHHMALDSGNVTWSGAACLSNLVDSCRLLNEVARLKGDLWKFSKGYAPPKTKAQDRKDAYSATFFISSMNGSRKKILTLMDLPGELCLAGGSLDRAAILNRFKVAMACDTFITCFDTSVLRAAIDGVAQVNLSEEEQKSPIEVIEDTCRWADAFQRLLVDNTDKQDYVPAMLLFTKCTELENPDANQAVRATSFNAIKNCYLFHRDETVISANPAYAKAMDKFSTTGRLGTAFHAVLRSSPYGYPAPTYEVAEKFPEKKAMLHPPTPKNQDSLMRWILMVSGCIPVTGEYRPNGVNNVEGSYKLTTFIDRPQFRKENPVHTAVLDTYKTMCPEAMARCVLFANPGRHDMEFVRNFGKELNWIEKKKVEREHLDPDTNG